MEMPLYEMQSSVPFAGLPLLLTDDPDKPTNPKGTALPVDGDGADLSRPQRTDDPDKPGPKGTALPIMGD